jgi:hypothetical protein
MDLFRGFMRLNRPYYIAILLIILCPHYACTGEVEPTATKDEKKKTVQLSQEEWWMNTECSSDGCPLENPYTSWNDSSIAYTNDSSLIQNSMLHYGSFCGPGPKLVKISTTCVD